MPNSLPYPFYPKVNPPPPSHREQTLQRSLWFSQFFLLVVLWFKSFHTRNDVTVYCSTLNLVSICRLLTPAQRALQFAFLYLVASSCERDLSAPVVIRGEWDQHWTSSPPGFCWGAQLSNDDGDVNENVEKQWIKLQNTITARGNATTWPLFRRRL